MLGIFRNDSKDEVEAVGMAEYLEENPSDGYPWLGALQIASVHQRQGLATEAFDRLAEYFRAEYGWRALRLGVLRRNAPALAFWSSLGFRRVERSGEADPLAKWIVLERELG
jgi:RimJ/RimL family protein N-acetyltransferase